MRGVTYALTAFVALVLGSLTQASAGCYGECNGYQDNRGPGYERYSERPYYGDSGYQRSYSGGPRYHTTYYERGEEYPVSYYERPAYRTGYYDGGYRDGGYRDEGYRDDGYRGGGYGYGNSYSYDGYYDRPYRSYRSGYGYGYGGGYGYRGYGYGGYGYGYPTVRVGGGWSQTASALGYGYRGNGYSGYGGCRSAYIPYGWSWYRGTTC